MLSVEYPAMLHCTGVFSVLTFPTRNRIPQRTQTSKTNQHNASVVHRDFRNRKYGWHTKQHHLEEDPCDGTNIRCGAKQAAYVPFCMCDFLSTGKERDDDRNEVPNGKCDDAYGCESSESAAGT